MNIPVREDVTAERGARALGWLVLGSLLTLLLAWASGTLWAQKLDVGRFRADSISRDALEREMADRQRELLQQSTVTSQRVRDMYCATIPRAQRAGCN